MVDLKLCYSFPSWHRVKSNDTFSSRFTLYQRDVV
jgi:hypothetical protein